MVNLINILKIFQPGLKKNYNINIGNNFTKVINANNKDQ